MPPEKLRFSFAVIAVIFVISLLITVAFCLYKRYLKRKNKLMLEEERILMQFEKTLLESSLEIQQETFAKIGREIHDNIGQILSLARINLSQAKLQGETSKLVFVDELLDKVMVDLRDLNYSLESDLTRKRGWLEALSQLMLDLEKTGKLLAHLAVAEDIPILEKDRSIILFRMVQEILNLIAKSENTKRIAVSIEPAKDAIIILITTSQKQFDLKPQFQEATITNLEKRSRIINATLTIERTIGTDASIILLVKQEKNA